MSDLDAKIDQLAATALRIRAHRDELLASLEELVLVTTKPSSPAVRRVALCRAQLAIEQARAAK
jgi:hypothetical protein